MSPACHRGDMCAPIKNRHLLQERRFIIVSIGLPGKIRTCDLMVRSHRILRVTMINCPYGTLMLVSFAIILILFRATER